MNYALIENLCRNNGIKYSVNEPLKLHTTMKIGGECDMLVCPKCEDDLSEVIRLCRRENIPYFVLGRGSNVLASSRGYRGCIISMCDTVARIETTGCTLTATAGAGLSAVCRAALANSLTGLEFAAGIPGSVGGALYMNAGAYGGEMKDVVKSCRYIDENGNIGEMEVQDMQLAYRRSFFTGKSWVITSVTMELKKGDESEIRSRMNELMQKRRDKQPLEYPSCGSTFKRPEGFFAAALIEECGLKGCTIGGAQVSEKHSGFVINRGDATFEDVMALVEHIKKTVLRQKGVALECEMMILE